MDEADVIQHLEAVPSENIFPLVPKGFTIAPPFDAKNHYLKAPQFNYDDRHPGNTFVANVLLHEASVLEQLRQRPHPSLVTYYGVVVKDDRITHLCLKRCRCNLVEYLHVDLPIGERERIMTETRQGIEHLHSLGLAHNDINPRKLNFPSLRIASLTMKKENICIDSKGHAVIVDFDATLAFGKPLLKGVSHRPQSDQQHAVSARENDFQGLIDVEQFLFPPQAAPERHPYAEEGHPRPN